MVALNREWDTNLKDADWVQKSFMLSEENLARQEKRYRIFTTADAKFTTTRLGYNWAINTPPQRTANADIKFGGDLPAMRRMLSMVNKKTGKIDLTNKDYLTDRANTGNSIQGMGRWYSEAIDDNAQLIHMSFGVPNFRGLTSFFTGFYDSELGLLANQGRANPIIFSLGKIAGFCVVLPYIHLVMIGRALNWIVHGGVPPTSYYSMNRKMHLYWQRADFIANSIAVNLGIVPRTFNPPTDATLSLQSQTSKLDNAYAGYFRKYAPDIFRDNGTVDLYRVASRAQRLANQRYKDIQIEKNNGLMTNIEAGRAELAKFVENWHSLDGTDGESIEDALQRYFAYKNNQQAVSEGSDGYGDLEREMRKVNGGELIQTPAAATPTDPAAPPGEVPPAPIGEINSVDALNTDETGNALLQGIDQLYPSGAEKDEATGFWKTIGGWFSDSDYLALVKAENTQGSQWITWKVDHNGTMNETFTNSFGSPAIKEKINSASSAARSARFDYSDGKLGIGGLDQAVSALRDFTTGVLEGVSLSGLIALSGSAFTDFPDTWQDSAASATSQTFTIKLRPWAGNKLAQYLQMYVPLSLLLAAALPLSTGPQSYTAPFLCEMWSRGRNQIRLGMIDSLDITRGTGNMGWNNENEALGIDISFSVKDLSTIVHAPISSFSSTLKGLNPINTLFPNDSKFNDYLATLGNLSMMDQTQFLRKLALNMTRYGVGWSSFWSVSRSANWYGSSFIGQTIQNISRDSERGL